MTWFLLAILALYLTIVIFIAWLSLHPLRTPVFISPGIMGVPQEDVFLEGKVGTIRGWWVEAENATSVMVFIHGYVMNRAELTPVAVALHQQGISSLLIDLRAHGKSGGKKCTLGYREREDVAVVLRYARERAAGRPVGVIGSSMGSAASALALGDDPSLADLLVMDSGYSMLAVAIMGWWRFLGGRVLQVILAPTVFLAAPMAGFWPFSVDIAKALGRFGYKPVLHLHGTKDTLAPPSEARRNHAACKGPSEIVWFEGYQHSEYRWEDPERYMAELTRFLKQHGFLV
jgi:uncharacterized protein